MKYLNAAIFILGILSFLSLVAFSLALHDIWHDYASPEVWTRAGQPLPEQMSPVPGCSLEWGMMRVGFVFISAFHLLLFVRLLKRVPTPTPALGKAGNFQSQLFAALLDGPRDSREVLVVDEVCRMEIPGSKAGHAAES